MAVSRRAPDDRRPGGEGGSLLRRVVRSRSALVQSAVPAAFHSGPRFTADIRSISVLPGPSVRGAPDARTAARHQAGGPAARSRRAGVVALPRQRCPGDGIGVVHRRVAGASRNAFGPGATASRSGSIPAPRFATTATSSAGSTPSSWPGGSRCIRGAVPDHRERPAVRRHAGGLRACPASSSDSRRRRELPAFDVYNATPGVQLDDEARSFLDGRVRRPEPGARAS